MRRYSKNRTDSDCDSLHSSSFDSPMEVGCVPITMGADYGKNGAKHILFTSKLRLYNNWPWNIEESDAYLIGKLFRI